MARPDRPGRGNGRSAPEDIDAQAQVRLKPILGVRPGTYLTVLYALGLLLLLFLLLFSKGLRERATYLDVTTYPPGAAVSVDGRYAGSTPCQIRVRRGPHTVTASMPFYAPAVLQDEFPGPVFGTLFVRPRRQWTATLSVDRPAELVTAALQELAASPHIPQIMSRTAAAAAGGPEAAQRLHDFVDSIKYFVSNSAQAVDYVQALGTGFSHGAVLTPSSLAEIVNYIAHSRKKYDNSPLLLALLLPEEQMAALVRTPWYSSFLAGYRDYLAEQQRAAGTTAGGGPFGAVSVGGLVFSGVPGGTLRQGLGPEPPLSVLVPHPVALPAFYVSRTEVSNRLYKRFVAENPVWSKANLAQLRRDGRVTDEYLASWEADAYPSGADELPVTGVSYHAAEAFCAWLGRSLPASLAGFEARLPFESEWEWAARGGLVGRSYPRGNQPEGDVFFEQGIAGPRPVGASPANGYGLHDMAGNVWEWCLDWYSATKYIFSARTAAGNAADSRAEIPQGAQKVIRGGGWANEKELVKVFTRGSQPPEWCTPYLGFRVVLARTSP